MNIGNLISKVAVPAAKASDIVGKAVFFVQAVETVAEQLGGLPGAQKLAAVKQATLEYVRSKFPNEIDRFEDIWDDVAGIVSGVVALYNATGFFKKLAGKVL